MNDESKKETKRYEGCMDPENESNNYVKKVEVSSDVQSSDTPDRLNDVVLPITVTDSDYCLDTTVNQQILPQMRIPVLTTDGRIVGSGISMQDIALKPSICGKGDDHDACLAFFDTKGNLMAGSFGGFCTDNS